MFYPEIFRVGAAAAVNAHLNARINEERAPSSSFTKVKGFQTLDRQCQFQRQS